MVQKIHGIKIAIPNFFAHSSTVVPSIAAQCEYTVKTMENVRGHFAAFLAFKTKNQRHIIILLFETLQLWFK